MRGLDHERVTNLFAEASQLPPARREAFLDSTCAGESELRREVEELLSWADRASAAFDAAETQIVESDPQRIGPYQLLEPIGEGGMAIVYKARQHQPVQRTVALKLIKLGMDTRQFVARFESERQALAMMDHPNLARVYDAGSTEIGRPYFVMEYVPGESILQWCDARKLPIRQRLELFISVCDAVEHAHRRGIIHRDLKDSNVLVADVDGRAQPKVIDFGVAKAVSQRLTDRTMFTEQGQLIGTPEYMSPEQAARGALDIDTRSDIYSLGVLLYELIAGVQAIPSDVLRGAGLEQVQQIILETEPSRPSTRLSTLGGADAARIAERRRSALPTLIRDLRSELEWIPLKAMRKDREQRYRSAAELADDIRNYLGGRPLIAGPESSGYKLRKFIRRHKTGVAASAGMILLLLSGIVATTWQAVRATRAERHADREAIAARKQASIARSVNHLMTDMILKANRSKQGGDPNVTVRAVMDAAAAELGAGNAPPEPEVEAALRAAIGATYSNLGLYDAAEPLLRRSMELRLSLGDDQTLEGADSRSDLATVLQHRGKYEEAEKLYREALAIRRRLLRDEHSDVAMTLQTLGAMFWSKGDYAAAEPLFRDSLAMQRRLLGDEHRDVAHSLGNLSALLIVKGDYDAAEPVCREALAMRRKLYGAESTEVAVTLSNLAMLLMRRGDYAAAEAPTREALAMRRKLFGEDHPEVAVSLNNLAGLLLETGDVDGAIRHFQEALTLRRKLLGDDHPEVLMTMNNLGRALAELRDYPSAELLVRDALERSRRVSGDDHANTLSILRNLARSLSAQGRFGEAEPVLAELYRRAPTAQLHPRSVAQYVSFYGPCLAKLGRYQEAERPLREAYDRLVAAGLATDQRTFAVLDALADVCEHTNRPEEAAESRARLKQLQAATQPATAQLQAATQPATAPR